MTTLVLLILAGIWAAVILVPLVRARTEGSLGDSIGTFRRHLSVLERAAPRNVSPANRLRIPGTTPIIPPYRPASPRSQSGPGGPIRPVRPVRGYRAAGPVAETRRRRGQKRRRDVLMALVAGLAGSLLLGLIPGLQIMLVVHLVFDVLFVGYVFLLVRMRNVAAERDMTLTFLPPQPAPAHARRRGPVFDDTPAHGLNVGYPELRRAAN